MTHKELFQFIKNKLEENGFKCNSNKDFFKKFLPEENYARNRSNISNWFGGKPGRINNNKIKVAIAKRLNFDVGIWDEDTRMQKDVIINAIKNFTNPTPKINLDELLPKNTPLSDEQINLLVKIKKSTKEEALTLLKKHDNFLQKTPGNQLFLLKLLSLLFEKGMYALLIDKVFPSLLPHNATQNHIKIFKAHTLGSLDEPDYLGAASLLQTIDSSSTEEILELQTGLISNIRRHKLEKDDLTKEELITALSVFIRYYSDVFDIQKHHYYPGVNLVYMLKLSGLISPNNPIIADDDLKEIYHDAKASMSRDSSSRSEEMCYYAKMSEVEFRLLLDLDDADILLGNLLDLDAPSATYIERTLRMMRFFTRTLKRFALMDAREIIARFEEVIEILEGYERL